MTNTKRKIVKALSWRLVGIISLGLISFAMGNSLGFSGILSLLHAANQIVLFYFHEKLWDRSKWGKLQGIAIQMTGLSGAGKTTISERLKQLLEERGMEVELIDGDEYRKNLCSDLGFSKDDRIENIRRLSFVAHKLAGTGKVSIIAAINPYEEARSFLKGYSDRYVTAFIHAPLKTVIGRDVKGLYARAMKPADDPQHLPNFTGISDAFEEPKNPDIVLNTHEESAEESAQKLFNLIMERMK